MTRILAGLRTPKRTISIVRGIESVRLPELFRRSGVNCRSEFEHERFVRLGGFGLGSVDSNLRLAIVVSTGSRASKYADSFHRSTCKARSHEFMPRMEKVDLFRDTVRVSGMRVME